MAHYLLATNSTSSQDLCQILMHERSVFGIGLFLQLLLTVTPEIPKALRIGNAIIFGLLQ